jgi:glucan 1,3-beta-glucosidase
MADGHRCGEGCGSSTIVPAVVYFPSGTYKISTPIVSWYYTQMIGDAKRIPVIKAARNFDGIAMIGELVL